jgi:hypothetical protein
MERPTTADTYRRRPADVLAAVEAGLRSLGVGRLYLAGCPPIAVLSVAPGVTAWCDGHTLTWKQAGEQVTWPVADVEGAARRLADLAANTGAR